MATFPHVEAFLLVGGKSSRMGRDKALLEFSGTPLVQRMANLVAPLVSKTTLATAASSAFPVNTKRYFDLGLPTVADRWPNFGPLGAIATSLAVAQTPWSLILACDMPFLTVEWLTFLLNQIPHTIIEDAIVPETARGLEPLCAVYNSAAAGKSSRSRAESERRPQSHLRLSRNSGHIKPHRVKKTGASFRGMETFLET